MTTAIPGLHTRTWGDGPPVILVHGSNASDPAGTWAKQRELADAYRLVVVDRRGYGASPLVEKRDFEIDVLDVIALLGDGAHLVGFSYGGVLSLIAAARRPELVWSLTVIEPPAFAVARGHPGVERVVGRMAPLFTAEPPLTEERFIRGFRHALDIEPYDPPALSEKDRIAIRGTLAEPGPWEAVVPLNLLACTRFPKLVVSGNWNPGLEAVADVLTARLPAERAVIPGAGHSVQHTGAPFNARLRPFLAGSC